MKRGTRDTKHRRGREEEGTRRDRYERREADEERQSTRRDELHGGLSSLSSFHSSPIPIPFPTSRRLRRALRAEARRGGMGGDGEVTRNEVRSRVKEITVHRKFPRLALYVHLPHSHHSPRAAARFAGETGSGGRRME